MKIEIPKLSLIVLIGASSSGKSTFARKHFLGTEILSSDHCRGLISDDENNQRVTPDAFDLLHFIAAKRLALGKLTVIDATNVQQKARKPLIDLARKFHVLPIAFVFDMSEKVCRDRHKSRSDRNFGEHVIWQHRSQLRRSINRLNREGFRHIFKLTSEDQVNSAEIERVPLWNDKTDLIGPFDIIGDIHGCYDELIELLEKLDYRVIGQNSEPPMNGPIYAHPENRIAIFLGDLVDRGPRVLDTIKLIYNMVKSENALCVPGNHDSKFMRKLQGRNVKISHGLAKSLQEFDALPIETRDLFKKEAIDFIYGLVSHYVLDRGKLVVAHAGLKQDQHGRASARGRDFCLYGDPTGETDEHGLPIRRDWAAEYRGSATVVYGHTPVPTAEWLNRTINIDTGCVFGGELTALRYPERELISVPARAVYAEPIRPIQTDHELTAQQIDDDLLNADDVIGKRHITTKLRSNIAIREENSIAALEVMSRFAIDPKWLIYLPPTMSPCETSQKENFLEYPIEAFEYFRSRGTPKAICQEKHMGSRAIVIVCENPKVATRRFGIESGKIGEIGVVYTRTGRQFFNDPKLEKQLLDRVRKAISASNFWREFKTEWACFDCELMPWSEKAQTLIQNQYAATASAATHSIDDVIELLKLTSQRDGLNRDLRNTSQSTTELDIDQILKKFEDRKKSISKYVRAYQHYCWEVNSINDLKLAPFHLLATEDHVHTDRGHDWHIETLKKICEFDKDLLLPTNHKIVDFTDESSVNEAIAWWETITENGGEGMVVKPIDFVAKGKKGLIQPAIKCRGREYLRIIYGPEYTAPQNLERLRSRSLRRKRSLALNEFALGIEALDRFVKKEPLRRVHECVFGVLALESEPIDPRL